MKKLIFLILLTSLISFAQEQPAAKEEPKTKLEKFFSKAGNLYIKEFSQKQTLSGNLGTEITFQSLKVYNPGEEKNATKGIKITIASYKKEASVFLDIDEIESLQRAMDYLYNESAKIKSQKNHIEITFSTKDDFQFGGYNKDDEINLFATINKYPYPNFFADFDQLNSLKVIIANYLIIK